MKTKTIIKSGLKVRGSIKAGGFTNNHARSGIKVRAGIRSGGALVPNHSLRLLGV